MQDSNDQNLFDKALGSQKLDLGFGRIRGQNQYHWDYPATLALDKVEFAQKLNFLFVFLSIRLNESPVIEKLEKQDSEQFVGLPDRNRNRLNLEYNPFVHLH